MSWRGEGRGIQGTEEVGAALDATLSPTKTTSALRCLTYYRFVNPSMPRGDDDVELDVLGCRVGILGTNNDQCLSMVQRCFTSTETIRLIRDVEPRTATSTSTQFLNSDAQRCVF